MQTTTYFLLEDQERDVIVRVETGLRVNVFGLELEQYQPTAGEIHIFDHDHGEWLAFETDGWTMEDQHHFGRGILVCPLPGVPENANYGR